MGPCRLLPPATTTGVSVCSMRPLRAGHCVDDEAAPLHGVGGSEGGGVNLPKAIAAVSQPVPRRWIPFGSLVDESVRATSTWRWVRFLTSERSAFRRSALLRFAW